MLGSSGKHMSEARETAVASSSPGALNGTPTRALAGSLTGTWAHGWRALDLEGRPVLVATDGSDSCAGAARIAAALAERHHAVVHAVTVVDARAVSIPPTLDIGMPIADPLWGRSLHEDRANDVRASLETAVGVPLDWPIEVMLDTPAMGIAKEAHRLGAALIIAGLRRHGRLERAVTDETMLSLMRHAPCPVLAVLPGATSLPRRVLVAVDFSETSLVAARIAAAVAADGASVVMAYVPPLVAYPPDDGERVIHDLGVEAAFAQTSQELASDGIRFDYVTLHRQRPRSCPELLLEYADGATADLIAAGSARHGRVERWILGSVSTELVRDGRRSILVVPPRDAGPAVARAR